MSRQKLKEAWDQAAANPGTPVDIGRTVVCDCCDEDFTDSAAVGGFIFSSSAYCPSCAVAKLPSIRGYGEERFIRARCPDGKAFADFVREYRGSNNNIGIYPAA